MRKIPVIFIKEEKSELCKKKFMTLDQFSKLYPKYQIYLMGTMFVIPNNYDKIKVEEKKPEDFTERIGVSQIKQMYKDLNRRIENER